MAKIKKSQLKKTLCTNYNLKKLLYSVQYFLFTYYWTLIKNFGIDLNKFNIKKKVWQSKKLKSKTSKIYNIKFYKGYKVKTKSSLQFR